MSRVLKRCRRSPFTRVSMSVLVGSVSPTAIHGPIEVEPSKFFGKAKLSEPPDGSRGARMLQSARMVTPQT